MEFVSKYEVTPTIFMRRKYKNHNVAFRCFDDYLSWLFYTYCKNNSEEYYYQLEDDFIEYSKYIEKVYKVGNNK